MKIYGYPYSSASYRVAIACRLKNVSAEEVLVDFRNRDQHLPAYLALAPNGLVPTLVGESGLTLTQSLAIIKYLDHFFPEPPLFPEDPINEARAWEMALAISCDIHPLNNLRVLKYLKRTMGADERSRNDWYQHWIKLGFEALEKQTAAVSGSFCIGDAISLADICLVPQVTNARRFDISLDDYPNLVAIDSRLRTIDAFRNEADDT